MAVQNQKGDAMSDSDKTNQYQFPVDDGDSKNERMGLTLFYDKTAPADL